MSARYSIPLDFLVSIHGSLATPISASYCHPSWFSRLNSWFTRNSNIRKLLPSLLIFSSQVMVNSHLQTSARYCHPSWFSRLNSWFTCNQVVLPDHFLLSPQGTSCTLLPTLSTGHFLYSPANFVFSSSASTLSSFSLFLSLGLSRPSYSLPSSSNSLLSTYRFIQMMPNAWAWTTPMK